MPSSPVLTRALVLALVAHLPACKGATGAEAEEESSSGSTGDPTTSGSSGSTEGASSTGEPCPVGALECPCTEGGFCDAGLACDLGVCVEGCALGSLGCACTQGGTCDGGLECDAGMCIEGVSETCGDGVVDEFEECDDASDNGDDKACTSSCKLAVCGDGLVGPGEVCDGTEGCTEACALSTCGNGQLDPGEDCEPAAPDDVECSALCTDARKIIFVTSEHYKGGEIGGVEGGDAKCQALAEAAGLAGEFKSWLATSKDDAPLVRFTWSGAQYVGTDGAVLAAHWEELKVAPSLTEYGVMSKTTELQCDEWVGVWAWASTLVGPAQSEDVEYSCDGWTDNLAHGAASHVFGGPLFSGINPACSGALCDAAGPIFCFEQ